MRHITLWLTLLVGPWRRRALAVCWALLAFALLQFGAARLTQAQQGGADFDHTSTGFVLNGQHQNVRCETCHTLGTFKGTPKDCVSCHGWNNPRAQFSIMPRNHIPTGAVTCETCHQASQAQFADASLNFSHTNVVSLNCLNCHSSKNPHPGVMTNPADATHTAVLAQGQSCDKCHTTALFAGPKVPLTHIPTAAVACTACHTSSDYALMPSVSAIHANAQAGLACAACHEKSNAAKYPMTPALVAQPGNHVGMNGQGCDACHAQPGSSLQLPVQDGARFSGSLFSHTGITGGCATCHGPNVTAGSFMGVSPIVMPPTTSAGATSHIPSSTSCENCHAGNTPSGLMAPVATATVPGSGFQGPPLPSSTQIHMGVGSNCSACHDTNASWVGMTLYPMSRYLGFQTRPQATAGAFNVVNASHPSSGECSSCHTGISFDPANVQKPGNHIPVATGASCTACHTSGSFSVMPSLSAIHANIQNTSANCVQCHSVANAALYRSANNLIKAPDAGHISMGSMGCESCHVGANSSMATTPVADGANFANSLFNHAGASVSCATCHGATVTASTFTGVFPAGMGALTPAHVPSTASCDSCHGAAPTGLVPTAGMKTFANAQFDHGGVTTGCVNCHGPAISNSSFYGINPIIVMPPSTGANAHMPTSTTCESCHVGSLPTGLIAASSQRAVGSSLFRNSPPSSTQIHSNAAGSCSACHEAGMAWVGVDLPLYTRNPATFTTATALYKGFQTRPLLSASGYSVADPNNHPDASAGECSLCHGDTIAFGQPSAPTGHIPYRANAACSACHTSFGTAPAVGLTHANLQYPSDHCEQCHSTDNAALYAATTTLAPIKTPAINHIPMGALGCASCHVGGGSNIASTPVPEGSHFSNSAFSHTGITTGCANCHGANVVVGTFDGVTPKSVAGQSPLHIPVSSNVGCEICHANSIPSALVPPTGYSGSPSFAGGQYIHTGVTTACANCHVSGAGPFKGVGVNSLAVMPSTAAPSGHIPSTTTCENCHLGSLPSGLLSVTGASGAGFAVSPPDSAKIHADASGGCNSCHEAGNAWIGMGIAAYARNLTAVNTTNPNQLYTGFHTRAGSSAGYSMADANHPTGTGECSQCHGNTNAFGTPSLPDKHIPIVSGGQCTACHAPWGAVPTVAKIHQNLQSPSTNCSLCHSIDNATLYSTAGRKSIVRPASNHIPMRNQGCESCHIGAGSSMATATLTDASKFTGSAFSHVGMGSNCAECHGPNVTGFQGIGVNKLVLMPTTTPAGSGSHIPSSTSCETCHLGSMPSALSPYNVASTLPGSAFKSPAPNTAATHTGVSGGCSNCHEKDMLWMGVDAYNTLKVAPYTGFNTRPQAGVGTYWVTDPVHPVGGDCSSCHVGFSEWATNVKPANHIPTAAVACTACHTSTNYTTMPTLAAIHANAPSTSTNCAQCHSADNALAYRTATMTIKAPIATGAGQHIPMGNLGCESCHVGSNSSLTTPVQNTALFSNSAFSHTGVSSGCATCHGNIATLQGNITPVSMTTPALSRPHVPNPANTDCGICHTAIPTGLSRAGSTSTTFAAGKYSHAGISTGCDACHGSTITGSSFQGITAIVVLPPTSSGASNHIPSPINANCETCHLGSMPLTLINASASVTTPGSTKFKSPTPNGTMIHTGVTGSCNNCHEASNTWVNVSLYPRVPNVKTPGANYTGFHTRPNSPASVNSVLDANHPSGGGECSACHGSTTSFSAVAKPGNHIPTSASAQCQNCHTDLAASNGVPVSNTATFVQAMTLANIHTYAPSTTTNCAQCHSAANAATYAMPAIGFSIKSPTSVANHIPFGSTACEVCHVPTATPVASGTFAGGKYSHAGVTTGCAACHGAGISNTSFYGVTALVAIPASSSTPGSNTHIPYTASCEACHSATVPTGLVSVTTVGSKFATPLASGPTIHSNSASMTCNACHERGYAWLGMGSYPRTALNLAVPATAYRGFNTRPGATATPYGYTDAAHTGSTLDTGDCSLCHVGTTSFTAEGKPAGHMPNSSAACASCHVVAGDYSYAPGKLGTNSVLHSGVTVPSVVTPYASVPASGAACTACHRAGAGGTSGTAPFAGCATQASCTAPPPISYQPKADSSVAHIPFGGLGCDACHVGTTLFSGVNMASGTAAKTMHANVALAKIQCQSCHEYSATPLWYGLPSIQTRKPSKHNSANRMAPNDCSNCHSFNGGFNRGMQRPILRSALVAPDLGRLRPGIQTTKPSRGTLGNSFDHKGVLAGQCKTCHDGKSASGMPARHLMVSSSCDTCHRPTSWLPAQFNHSGVTPNTCQACHNGMSASGRPAGHFNTTRSCDNCHKNMAWAPVNYHHLSPLYLPSPDKLSCVSCHETNGELMRRQMRGLSRTKPIPVGQ